MRTRCALPALTICLAFAGCSGNAGTPLSPREFVTPRPGTETGILTKQTDQNGTLVYGELHAPLLPDEYTNTHPQTPPRISSAVRQVVSQTKPAASEPAAQAVVVFPAIEPSAPSGTYQVVGTVICVVNGHPIYADKVLARLEKQFEADARRMSYDAFKSDAADKISGMVDALAENERKIAAATEALGPDVRKNADAYAANWLDEQIKAAGGSKEVAKERVLRETGQSLEQEANDVRDQAIVGMYYQEKLTPLIQVSPTDIRRYYEQNLSTKYTQMAAARFRLIKISVAERGGIPDATRVIDRVLDQLKGGKDFATLAKFYNDDATLKRNAGLVGQDGWVQKGSFIDDDIENAVWKLSPGEYTEKPVQLNRDGTICLAYLDAKKPGAVTPFDDQVQKEIRRILETQQLTALDANLRKSLDQQSVRIDVKGGVQLAVQMAMQRYPAWAAEK